LDEILELAKLNLKIHEMKKSIYSSSFLSLKMDKVLESFITNTHLLPFEGAALKPKKFPIFYITTTKVRLFCTPNQIMSPFSFSFSFLKINKIK
jgi:hypothetical protein